MRIIILVSLFVALGLLAVDTAVAGPSHVACCTRAPIPHRYIVMPGRPPIIVRK
jgi:hypothetical protein